MTMARRRDWAWRCRARWTAPPSAATGSSVSCVSSSASCVRSCGPVPTWWWRAQGPRAPMAPRCARGFAPCCSGPARCPVRPWTAQCPAPLPRPPAPDPSRRTPPASELACLMNQTRTLLIFAWLMVAMLLWMEWRKEADLEAAPAAPAIADVQDGGSVPDAAGAGDASVPTAPSAPSAPPPGGAVPDVQAPGASAGDQVTVVTDVLRLTLQNGNAVDAALLQYPQSRDEDSPPVKLFDTDPARWYAAQSGWVSQANAAPTHEAGFVAEGGQREYRLTGGEEEVTVPFVWNGPDGVQIRRTFTVRPGSYAIDVQDTVVNAGGQPWQGYIYRQLSRVPPRISRGMTNAEPFSFNGATWYSDEGVYTRHPFADFAEDGPLNLRATESWIAILQHHFFSAWIPRPEDQTTISVHTDGPRYLVRQLGPGLSVAPGQQASLEARLLVGPKLVDQIKAQDVRGLDRAIDYSRFSAMAFLGEWLFWLLDKIHGLVKNWGWAIVGLVVVVKLGLYQLSAARYKSLVMMRRLQLRMMELKVR